jgi:hypothetical protein
MDALARHSIMRSASLWICLLLLLTACQRQPLLVETEYVSVRSLASHWVRTPDPHRNCPATGQRLFVSWRIPLSYLQTSDLHVELTVRFGDNSEDFQVIPISTILGTWTYSVLGDDYWNRCGIRTYRAKLIGGGEVLECWEHQLWATLIELEAPDESVDWLAD